MPSVAIVSTRLLPLALSALALGLAEARQAEEAEGSGNFAEFAEVAQQAEHVLKWESLPVVMSPLVAVVGFFVKSFAESRGRARQLQLERVQLQIQEFYGPISALSHRGKTAFNSMLDVYAQHIKGEMASNPDLNLKDRMLQELASMQGARGEDPARNPAVILWVQFIRSIAFPVNSKIVDVLTEKSHLHDGPLPDDYLDLFALVAERELVIAQWDQGDYSQLLFQRRFPTEFDRIIAERLHELQELQLKLTGLERPGGKASKKPGQTEPQKKEHVDSGEMPAVGRSHSERYCLIQDQ